MPSRRISTLRAEPVRSGLAMFWGTGEGFWPLFGVARNPWPGQSELRTPTFKSKVTIEFTPDGLWTLSLKQSKKRMSYRYVSAGLPMPIRLCFLRWVSLGRPALAMCGDAAQAEKLAGETSKLFPNGIVWNSVQLPEIRAAIELQLNQPAKAVELLASASPYERAYPEAVYLRDLAYLRLRKGVEAVAEFRKILDHNGASWVSMALSELGTVLFDFLSGSGAGLRARGRHGEGEESLSKTSSHFGSTPTRISLS